MRKQAGIYSLFDSFDKVMTVKEVADTVRCSPNFILSLIHDGRLPSFCIGTHYRIKKEDAVICFSGNSVFYPEIGGECYCEIYGN